METGSTAVTGGYKKMSYGDKDFDYAERMETPASIYGLVFIGNPPRYPLAKPIGGRVFFQL